MTNILNELVSSEVDARKFGFDWPNREMIVDCIMGECQEVLAAIKNQESAARVQEEIGDIFHAVISLCVSSDFNVEQTLQKAHQKFIKRIKALKEISRERGFENLSGQSIEFLLELWDEAKKATAHGV